MLKEIAALDSLAEKRFTGIETRPKEIVAEPFGRSAMARNSTLFGATGSQWPTEIGGSGSQGTDTPSAGATSAKTVPFTLKRPSLSDWMTPRYS